MPGIVHPPGFADARLNALTAAGTRVNRDPKSLLRYGLPLAQKDPVTKELREAQTSMRVLEQTCALTAPVLP